jgi:hypothetical protein
VVILEKESTTGDITHKLVFPEVPERRVVGNSNLQITSKEPMCYLFRVYWRPEKQIWFDILNILDREVTESLGGKGGCIKVVSEPKELKLYSV